MKGYIFDVDGVLLDSMFIWDNLADKYLLSLGIEPEMGLSEKMYTMTIEESGVYLQEHYLPEKSVSQIIQEVLSMIQAFYTYEVQLKPGVKEFLNSIKEEPKIILTSNDRSLIEPALKRLGIISFFSTLLTCPEEKVSKNEPDMYKKALRLLQKEPKDVYYFDDSYLPLVAAKNVGIQIIGVEDASSKKDRETIKEISTKYIIDFTQMFE